MHIGRGQFLPPDHKLARNWPTVSRGGGILWRPPSRTACFYVSRACQDTICVARMVGLCEFIRQTTTWSIYASLRSSEIFIAKTIQPWISLLWTPAQFKRASMLYFVNVFIYLFFYGRLILRPWLTEVRESFTRDGPWVSLEKLLLGFFPGHP